MIKKFIDKVKSNEDLKEVTEKATELTKDVITSDAGKQIAAGAAAGAVIASVVPLAGTVVGAQIGAAIGAYKYFTKENKND